MRLRYGKHNKDDCYELMRLRSQQSGWDVLENKMSSRFLDTPFGDLTTIK